MKGAFEYACKIWEEQLPPSLPIRILAKVGRFRGSNSQSLCNTSYATYNINAEQHNATSVNIKRVLLGEYDYKGNFHYIRIPHYTDIFDSYDMTIAINENYIDEFSFSINNEVSDKYDFVTLIIREIAKGIGISCGIRGSVIEKAVFTDNFNSTYFEKLILESLGTTDKYQAYEEATKGFLDLKIPMYGNVRLYAPQTWENGVSLNAFIQTQENQITNILTYNFGRGCIMRDIYDPHIDKFYRYALNWYLDELTGGGQGGRTVSSNNDEVIPYKGTINLQEYTTSQYRTGIDRVVSLKTTKVLEDNELYINYDSICKPYSCQQGEYYSRIADEWIISILKKDGTWDKLCNIPTSSDENLDLSTVEFHYADNEYARTSDGYLKCRITLTHQYSNNLGQGITYSPKFIVIDYLPQIGELDFIGVSEENTPLSVFSDDYFQDVKIGLKNLEGTNKVMIEQLDEGAKLPIRYEITDFKKGYFIANVDKEFETKLTAVFYNNNGSTRSETLIINPQSDRELKYNLDNNQLTINTNKQLKFEIIKLENGLSSKSIISGTYNPGEQIDTSNLCKGLYILRINNGRVITKKFTI